MITLHFKAHIGKSMEYISKLCSRLVAKSCPTLCNLMGCSLPGSSVHGIFQARYWSGVPFSSLGDLPNPGIKLRSPALQANSLPSEPPGTPTVNLLVLGYMEYKTKKISPSPSCGKSEKCIFSHYAFRKPKKEHSFIHSFKKYL